MAERVERLSVTDDWRRARKVRDGQIELGVRLVAARKTSAGREELTFRQGSKTVTRVHDAVVLTLPFSVLREVALDASLQLTDKKRRAIQQLGYGTNAKTMLGFSGRPWMTQGADGTVFANLPNVQIAWRPTRSTPRPPERSSPTTRVGRVESR